MSSKLEPTIWSRDTGQQIPCIDRCQLTITWMSNIKVHVSYKPRLHVSVNPLAGVMDTIMHMHSQATPLAVITFLSFPMSMVFRY